MQEVMERDEQIELIKHNITHLCDIFNFNLLLDYLLDSDFFEAPASTRFHGSYKGGLAIHTYNVYNELYPILKERTTLFNPNEVAFKLALCHDLCKIGVYKTEMRNTKNEKGEWIKVPFYIFDDPYPYGHGEKSVQLAELWGVELTAEEKLAIRWHMGAFDQAVKGGFNISPVFESNKLALYLHIADMLATYGGNE